MVGCGWEAKLRRLAVRNARDSGKIAGGGVHFKSDAAALRNEELAAEIIFETRVDV